MKIIASLWLVCLFTVHSLQAATNITATSISGHWTLAGSPYYIHGSVSVDPGQLLTIDAGVQVIFKGSYSMLVWGSLVANGTLNTPIVFDVEDTTGWYVDTLYSNNGGWRGIYFSPYSSTAPDVSSVSYCNFHHLKWFSVDIERAMHMHHCAFSNNKGGGLALTNAGPGSHEISDCKFYNNEAMFGALLAVRDSTTEWYIHDNEFYDNTVRGLGKIVNVEGSTVLFSKNKVFDNAIPLILADTTTDAKFLRFVGFYNVPCYAVVSENQVYNNKGNLAGIIFSEGAIIDFHRNYICNNYHLNAAMCAITHGGGSMYLKGNGDHDNLSAYTVRDNVIANNYSALYGGGIGIYGARALISNNTIINNKAPRGGGIDLFMFEDVSVCLRNNILFGNENETLLPGNIHLTSIKKTNLKYDHNWSAYSFSYDVQVQPVIGGSVNLLSDTSSNIIGTIPGLVSPTLTASYTESALTADFSLAATSQCIDNGIDSAAVIGSADYAGNNRFSGNAVDIGAFEYGASSVSPVTSLPVDTMFKYCCTAIKALSVPNIKTTTSSITIYPNPASSIVFIKTPDATGDILILDALGKQVACKKVAGTLSCFDIHQLPRGFYKVLWQVNDNYNAIQTIIME